MSTVIPKKLTAEEFERAPELAAGHELICGELVPTMPSNLIHGFIAIRLGSRLCDFVERKRLGIVFGNDTGFFLSADTLRGPDLAFVRAGRLPQPIGAEFGKIPPDLAVEVVSPNDTAFDVEDKVQTYLEAGVALVWVVYPHRRTVHVYRPGDQASVLSAAMTLEGEDVLPGFQLPLQELFREASS